MANPVFQTIGTRATGNVASLTPAMPASIAANDTLIAWVTINATGKSVGTPSGWTLGDSTNTGNMTGFWFWKNAAGGDTSPVLSWTGSANAQAQVMRFSGAGVPATPIGAKNKATANTSATITAASITTTTNNCLLVYMLSTAVNQTIQLPNLSSGPSVYTLIQQAAGTPSDCLCDGIINVSGNASIAISEAVTSTDWVTFGFEIVGTGAAGTDNIRATGVNQQVLESYSNATNVRATGVNAQVLESYSAPVTNVRVTGVVLQVLRSVSSQTLMGQILT